MHYIEANALKDIVFHLYGKYQTDKYLDLVMEARIDPFTLMYMHDLGDRKDIAKWYLEAVSLKAIWEVDKYSLLVTADHESIIDKEDEKEIIIKNLTLFMSEKLKNKFNFMLNTIYWDEMLAAQYILRKAEET